MNKLFKLLFICLAIVCLSSCSGNRVVKDSDIEGTVLDENNDEHGIFDATARTFVDTSSGAIVNVPGLISNLVDSDTITLDTKIVICYQKEDSKVKDNEIIVDFYQGATVEYYFIDDYKKLGKEAIQSVKCPAENVVLTKEGSYYVKGSSLSKAVFTDITLELGKHYVFQYGSVQDLIENYYNY